jgi:predicted transcriptional regulator
MNNRNIVQIFAENIMALRKKKGGSQYDLAQLTGISRRMICHYETEGMIPPGDRLQARKAAENAIMPDKRAAFCRIGFG